MLRFLHSGDIGDCIAAMPTVRALGGGHVVFTQHPNPRDFKPGFKMLRPLFLAQRWCRACTWEEHPDPVDFSFQRFRERDWAGGTSLAHAQAVHVGVKDLNTEPWLRAGPDPRGAGIVIATRSFRYRSFNFPWKQIAQHFGAKLHFIGLEDEYADFERVVGRGVPRIEVKDFQELAELMVAAELVISNQSSPGWVAMALGVNFVQESHIALKDSMIRRDNARFVRDGNFPFHLYK